ncbi:zinc ribbon domain-containing protein [Uliginosibacterium sp. H3]|uniref:Zinc ribbon domain-containing protein n=1 Tax=Uliginosibacterium silvisoli TaxID=3114758 RepID=A0ABU6K2B2_9RHOO|nr:zinc ribbon domain-containing protein [Uliginosibacterium sp. H3]
MPTYEYTCNECGDFDVVRSIASRNDPCQCPYCDATAERVMRTMPTLSTMAATTRTAHATNERAAHEPKHSSTHVHSATCGCGSGKKTTTVKAPDGSKAFPTKRPWMISH